MIKIKNVFQIKVILPILFISIWWFGISYLFAGWKGVGNSLYILINLIVSIILTYFSIRSIIGEEKMKSWGSIIVVIILIWSNVPFWILMKYNPFQ